MDNDPLLRLVLDQTKEHALILLDREATVIGWRMGAARLFGYEGEEMIGKKIDPLFTPEDRRLNVPQNELDSAARQGVGENDRWMVRKDGMRIFVSGVVNRLLDERGNIAGFSKVLRDRTDVRAQLENLRYRAEALENQVQRKGLLLDTLAHELRNPLGVLSNAVQMMEIARPRDASLADATALIRRQLRYLQSLVEDLLERGRLKAGKVTLQLEKADLRTLVDQALESSGAALRERRQSAEVLMPSIPIEADPTRLRQVFVNLISNASKFSKHGARMWIKGTTEGDEAVVRVQDEGRGIPLDLVPHVFELFTQGHQDSGGLGLGLTIVKEYVELHGGSVQVRSEGVGLGSEFIVRLPLRGEKKVG